MRMLMCEYCAQQYKPKDRHYNRPRKYCSNACRFAGERGNPRNRNAYREITYETTESGCHKCTSHAVSKTRGYVRICRDGHRYEMHRYLFQKKIGRILTYDELVCHTCHNKWCINVDHLYLGDKSSNAIDAVRHGVWNKKLDEDDVRFIKSVWRKPGITADKLAAKFGVTRHAIYHITKTDNRTWERVEQ